MIHFNKIYITASGQKITCGRFCWLPLMSKSLLYQILENVFIIHTQKGDNPVFGSELAIRKEASLWINVVNNEQNQTKCGSVLCVLNVIRNRIRFIGYCYTGWAKVRLEM